MRQNTVERSLNLHLKDDYFQCVPLLDKFHCFSIHWKWRFGLLGALLQSVTTFNERHYSIQVVHRLLKTVQLSEKNIKMKSLHGFKLFPSNCQTTGLCT